MPTKPTRQAANGKHNTLVKISQLHTNQLPALVKIPLLNREHTPSHIQNRHNHKEINYRKLVIDYQRVNTLVT